MIKAKVSKYNKIILMLFMVGFIIINIIFEPVSIATNELLNPSVATGEQVLWIIQMVGTLISAIGIIAVVIGAINDKMKKKESKKGNKRIIIVILAVILFIVVNILPLIQAYTCVGSLSSDS